MAVTLMNDPQMSAKNICDQLRISKSTLYRYLRATNAKTVLKGTVETRLDGA